MQWMVNPRLFPLRGEAAAQALGRSRERDPAEFVFPEAFRILVARDGCSHEGESGRDNICRKGSKRKMLWRQFFVIIVRTRVTSSPALATRRESPKKTSFEASFFTTRLVFFHPLFLKPPFLFKEFDRRIKTKHTKIFHARLLLPSFSSCAPRFLPG